MLADDKFELDLLVVALLISPLTEFWITKTSPQLWLRLAKERDRDLPDKTVDVLPGIWIIFLREGVRFLR